MADEFRLPAAATGADLPSFDQWDRARAVLEGDVLEDDYDGDLPPVVSEKAAARAAGVRLGVLMSWVKASQESGPDAEPWFRDIADVWEGRHRIQQGPIEDQVARMAFEPKVTVTEVTTADEDGAATTVTTTKTEGRGNLDAVKTLLKARQGIYAPKPKEVNVKVRVLNAEEAWARKQAANRFEQIEQERGETLEGEFQEVGERVAVGEFE